MYSSAGEGFPPSIGTGVDDVGVSIPPSERTVLYYIVIVLYTFMVFASLLINIFFSLVMLNGLQSYKKPFFRIIWQLVFANLISSISNIITTVPVTFFLDAEQSLNYFDTVFYKIINMLDTIGDHLVLFVTLVIAFHRLCIFVLPSVSRVVFTGSSLNILICSIWLLSTIISVFQFLFKCSYSWDDGFDRTGGLYQFKCKEIYYKPTTLAIEKALMAQMILFPIIDLLFYIIIFTEIVRRREGVTNVKKAEVHILKQAVVLFVIFEAAMILSYVSLYVTTQKRNAFLVRRIVNTAELFSGTVTPLLFFLTNKEARDCASRLNPANLQISIRMNSKVTRIKSSQAPSQKSLGSRRTQSVI